MRSFILAAALALVGAASASAQCTNLPGNQTCVSVYKLKITGSYADHIDIKPGQVLFLGMIAQDSIGRTIKNHIVTWAVDDTSIASVTQTGRLTGKKYGQTSVSLRVGLQSTSLAVLVTPFTMPTCTTATGTCPPVKNVVQIPPPVPGDTTDHTDIRVGFAYSMLLAAYDSNAANSPGHTVAWWSGNTDLATITTGGRVTGRRVGLTSLWVRVGITLNSMPVCISNADVVPLVLSSAPYSRIWVGDTAQVYVAGVTPVPLIRFEPIVVHGLSRFSFLAHEDSTKNYAVRNDPCVHWSSSNPNVRIDRRGHAVIGTDSTQIFKISDFGIKAALGRKMP